MEPRETLRHRKFKHIDDLQKKKTLPTFIQATVSEKECHPIQDLDGESKCIEE